jgi:RNA polymerase sigma factor (TIGR02999 family)
MSPFSPPERGAKRVPTESIAVQGRGDSGGLRGLWGSRSPILRFLRPVGGWLAIHFLSVIISAMADLTRILSDMENGDRLAADQLLPLVYDELRKLANQKLASEKPGQTLQATALVHEAYLRLVGKGDDGQWEGRRHFFAAAAEAMRRILIEKARQKRGPKYGGLVQRVAADLDAIEANHPLVDILALDEALTRLAEVSPARAELVKLRFFAGLTMAEAAGVLGISLATAERSWVYARTRLFADLGGEF